MPSLTATRRSSRRWCWQYKCFCCIMGLYVMLKRCQPSCSLLLYVHVARSIGKYKSLKCVCTLDCLNKLVCSYWEAFFVLHVDVFTCLLCCSLLTNPVLSPHSEDMLFHGLHQIYSLGLGTWKVSLDMTKRKHVNAIECDGCMSPLPALMLHTVWGGGQPQWQWASSTSYKAAEDEKECTV